MQRVPTDKHQEIAATEDNEERVCMVLERLESKYSDLSTRE